MSIAMTQTEIAIEKPGTTADVRNAILCGVAVVVAVALTMPISSSSFNDDWSYAQTVKLLSETGKLHYNGWASASLIAQAYWGLIWVKVFGYSQVVLRFSTVPLAAIAISICYLLARRAGLRPRFAVFSTLMVGLSPLYLPVASSFMTDAPGLFFIFLSMYLLARSITAEQNGIALAWLASGLLVGLVGGTGRQIVWVVPFVFGPYAAWLRRENVVFAISAVVGSILVFAGAMLTLRWFVHQPYSIPEAPLKYQFKMAMGNKFHFILDVLALPFTAVWVIIPALWGMLRGWTTSRALLSLLILIGPMMAIGIARPRELVAPWMGNTLSFQGVMGKAELHGDRPIVIPRPVRILIAVVVFVTLSVLVADLLIWFARPLTAFRSATQFIFYPARSNALLPAILLFSAGYFVLLIPRCATQMVYDRYLLPLMPCMLFPLMLQAQKRGEFKVPKTAWILLGCFTVYAIAITQDVTALGRAREAAANRLLVAGVPRSQIDGGFEYDFQTQILLHGYVNDPRILTPPHSWDKRVGPTHAMSPLYRLEYQPAPDTKLSKYGIVDYISFLPPFHRQIWINKFTDPWWLDPIRAATRPTDSRYQMMSAAAGDDTSK